MKIAYISDQNLPGDSADTEQLVNMASALGVCGATVSLVVPRLPHGPTREQICEHYAVAPTFTVHPLASGPRRVRALDKPIHAVRAATSEVVRNADLLYTRNLPTVLALRAATRTPLIYETYRPWPRQLKSLRLLFRTLARTDDSLKMVLHSRLAADSYAEVGFSRERLLVSHNGWDPKKLDPALTPAQARRLLDLDDDRITVVYAGRINPDKGLGIVLDMAAALPHLHFILVGSTESGPIERRAATMGNVTVRPWATFSQVVTFLYAADILLIPPSLAPLQGAGNTVLPIKTFQYMATGRPIFGPRSPDLLEVLTPDVSGAMVDPDNLDAAVAALDALAADPDRRRRLGAAARELAKGLTWEKRARQVLEFARP